MKAERWSRDATGRFSQRPFYLNAVIENKARQTLLEYATIRGEELSYPLTTPFLEGLTESLTEEFDSSVNLEHVGNDVDGYTLFSRTSKPRVLINEDLSDVSNASRRRMTIAHELGHVVLHQPLYERNDRQLELLEDDQLTPVYCEQRFIMRGRDWCEWQAGFFGGTLLVPSDLAREHLHSEMTLPSGTFEDGSPSALRAAAVIATHFNVSRDAARVRLSQLGLLSRTGQQRLDDTG